MLPEVNLLKRQNGKTHDQCQVFCSQSGKHLPAGLFEVYVQLDLIEAPKTGRKEMSCYLTSLKET